MVRKAQTADMASHSEDVQRGEPRDAGMREDSFSVASSRLRRSLGLQRRPGAGVFALMPFGKKQSARYFSASTPIPLYNPARCAELTPSVFINSHPAAPQTQ